MTSIVVKTQLPVQLLLASIQDKDCKVMPRALPTSLSGREGRCSAPHIHIPSAVIYMACNPEDVISSSYFYQMSKMLLTLAHWESSWRPSWLAEVEAEPLDRFPQ
ncbi:hypothetical protein AAES_101304 [Amazona aestiva]|uniref:Uncharacterized protein n=1 Tax=Amazona aestiva TaxID=12930 RepID=A0A0Q3MAG9_AMAAE|nr:hypothetical protein AAES_101304 [Amazona aestiva]